MMDLIAKNAKNVGVGDKIRVTLTEVDTEDKSADISGCVVTKTEVYSWTGKVTEMANSGIQMDSNKFFTYTRGTKPYQFEVLEKATDVHDMYRIVGKPEHSECERELLVETAHTAPPEIHVGLWNNGSTSGGYLNLTPGQALELGENIVARARALMED